MPNYYANLPAPEFRNALLDLSPVNNALSGVRQQNNENRNALLQQQQMDMRKEEQTYQRGRDAKNDAWQQVQRGGQAADAIQRMPDGPQKQGAWQNYLREYGDGNHTPEEMDYRTGPAIAAAAAGKFLDPRAEKLADLEVQKTQAQINNYNRQADDSKVMDVNGRLVRVTPNGAEEIYASPNADSTSRSKGAPAGYLWKDPNNPAAGVEPLPGFDRPIPGDVAGKVAMMNMARERIANTRQNLEKSWGIKGALQNAAANVPLVGDLAWASGDIGVAQRDVRTGIEAALRTMTGAAAPEQEVQRYMQMYAPGVNDTQETAKQKLDGLMKFMEDADRLVMQGRGTAPDLGTKQPSGGADLKAKYGLE